MLSAMLPTDKMTRILAMRTKGAAMQQCRSNVNRAGPAGGCLA